MTDFSARSKLFIEELDRWKNPSDNDNNGDNNDKDEKTKAKTQLKLRELTSKI